MSGEDINQLYYINDENSLVEVYLEFLLTHTDCIIDILGKHDDTDNLWVYHVADTENDRFGCITTDLKKWGDKRIKNPIKRYTNSTIFYITNVDTEEFDEVSAEAFKKHFLFEKYNKRLDQREDI